MEWTRLGSVLPSQTIMINATDFYHFVDAIKLIALKMIVLVDSDTFDIVYHDNVAIFK